MGLQDALKEVTAGRRGAQAWIARELGVTPRTVANWTEHGVAPEKADALARLLGQPTLTFTPVQIEALRRLADVADSLISLLPAGVRTLPARAPASRPQSAGLDPAHPAGAQIRRTGRGQ